MTDNVIYKVKWVSLCEDENWFNYLKVRLIERFVNGKYDKFIWLREWEKILQGAVIDPDKRNIVMSKSEKKKKNKEQLSKSTLIDNILLDI